MFRPGPTPVPSILSVQDNFHHPSISSQFLFSLKIRFRTIRSRRFLGKPKKSFVKQSCCSIRGPTRGRPYRQSMTGAGRVVVQEHISRVGFIQNISCVYGDGEQGYTTQEHQRPLWRRGGLHFCPAYYLRGRRGNAYYPSASTDHSHVCGRRGNGQCWQKEVFAKLFPLPPDHSICGLSVQPTSLSQGSPAPPSTCATMGFVVWFLQYQAIRYPVP